MHIAVVCMHCVQRFQARTACDYSISLQGAVHPWPEGFSTERAVMKVFINPIIVGYNKALI